jgi:hypothetical protein
VPKHLRIISINNFHLPARYAIVNQTKLWVINHNRDCLLHIVLYVFIAIVSLSKYLVLFSSTCIYFYHLFFKFTFSRVELVLCLKFHYFQVSHL